MIETYWILDITSGMFLIPTQEFGGTMMTKISLKLVIYKKGFILERVPENKKRKEQCQDQ